MTANTLPSAQVGNTGLQVTRLGMGTAVIGNLYATLSDADAHATVQSCYDGGVRFFDTAPLYGAGEAERRLGAALRGIPRDDVIIQTKVGRIIRPDRSIYFDYSRDGVMKSIEDSLERLEWTASTSSSYMTRTSMTPKRTIAWPSTKPSPHWSTSVLKESSAPSAQA